METNKSLIQFVRDSKSGQPRGVVVARKLDDDFAGIGWSYVNKKAGDKFDKSLGIKIANARIETDTLSQVPVDIKHLLDYEFCYRVRKYFKVKDTIVAGETKSSTFDLF